MLRISGFKKCASQLKLFLMAKHGKRKQESNSDDETSSFQCDNDKI